MSGWVRNGLIAVCLSLFVLLAACQGREPNQVNHWFEERDRIKVLSTVAMVDDLVAQIGGASIVRLTLICGEIDPHSYEMVKGDDEKLGSADVVFYVGLGLEHGASLHNHLENNGRAVAIGDAIVGKDPAAIIKIDGEKDPHIWTDVSLWLQGTDVIVEELSRLNPEEANNYRRRGEQTKARLQKLDQQVITTLDAVPPHQRYLVTGHDAFNYFTRRYLATDEERAQATWKVRCTAPEGLSPDGQLCSSDIRAIINHMADHDIRVLFTESNLAQNATRKVIDAGRKQGLDLRASNYSLFADAMGPPGSGGESYEKMMLHNACVIAEELQQP